MYPTHDIPVQECYHTKKNKLGARDKNILLEKKLLRSAEVKRSDLLRVNVDTSDWAALAGKVADASPCDTRSSERPKTFKVHKTACRQSVQDAQAIFQIQHHNNVQQRYGNDTTLSVAKCLSYCDDICIMHYSTTKKYISPLSHTWQKIALLSKSL